MIPKTLFVAMPFRPQFEPVYDIIVRAADLNNVIARRVDQEWFAGSIISHIFNAIEESDIVVAILDDENGNVYYEVGLAHSQAKPVIILTSDPTTLKFDLRDHRAIVYDLANPQEAIDALAKTISKVLDVPKDPKAYLSENLGSSSQNPQLAYEQALEKAKNTVIIEAKLQKPVKVTSLTFLEEDNEVAIELTDFMESRVRAVVDINGVIKVFKHL
jgi:hypothetical protein